MERKTLKVWIRPTNDTWDREHGNETKIEVGQNVRCNFSKRAREIRYGTVTKVTKTTFHVEFDFGSFNRSYKFNRHRGREWGMGDRFYGAKYAEVEGVKEVAWNAEKDAPDNPHGISNHWCFEQEDLLEVSRRETDAELAALTKERQRKADLYKLAEHISCHRESMVGEHPEAVDRLIAIAKEIGVIDG